MKKIIVKKTIRNLFVLEFLILTTTLLSFDFFINMQIAALSSFLIIVGSSYAYKKMINMQVQLENIDEKKDFLDEVEDPYELYDETPINDAPAEELDLKAIVKEEKKRIKILNINDIKKGSKASVSLFRLVPYLFLILGFIALKNNELLDIKIYLSSLFIGIVAGYFISRDLGFKIKS